MQKLASLLIAATGAPDDDNALAVGAALAAHSQALVRVQMLFPDPAADLVGWGAFSGVYIGPEVLEEIARAEQSSRADLTARRSEEHTSELQSH